MADIHVIVSYRVSLIASHRHSRDDLHWLPVPQRIDYKLCIITYRCLHQTDPKYLQELCVPVTITASCRHLHSAARGDLQVLSTRTVTFRPRSFAESPPPTLEQFTTPTPRLDTEWHLHNLAAGYKFTRSV